MVLSIFSTLRDAPPGQPASTSKHESLKENLNGVLAVFRNRYAPFFFVMVFVANPLVVCVLTLLGGPFLFDTSRNLQGGHLRKLLAGKPALQNHKGANDCPGNTNGH